MTPKQRVLKKYPRAGCQLSAMWGFQIVDYDSNGGYGGYGTVDVLSRSRRSEAAAWRNAARKL